MTFGCNIEGSKCIQCRCVSLWDGDISGVCSLLVI